MLTYAFPLSECLTNGPILGNLWEEGGGGGDNTEGVNRKSTVMYCSRI